jgi:streptogramin lyase
VLVLKDGALLVAERGSHDRLLRVDPATGSVRIVARGIDEPWGLAYARDGSILVSSTSGLYRIRPGGRVARVASLSLSPFAVLPDGRIAYANETSVGVLSGRVPRLLGIAVAAPHGLSLLPDGGLALSDSGNNRILRIDLATGSSSVLTSSVMTPLGLLAEPGGTLLVRPGTTCSASRSPRADGCTRARTSTAASRPRSFASAGARGTSCRGCTASTGSWSRRTD